ncbi:MAG: 5'/3'-nucleotidase SurE [Prevotellaceae bacterium]|jgi:5'-nucleotidase|nr:5'/3'-nucleotidase SurE [Prevotellaceae bacterium]
MQKKLIFITNDDGYRAEGLAALVEMARPFGDVVVVAPEEAQSGMSSALTSRAPVRLRKVSGGNGLTVYACSGTPVDCVKLAMTHVFNRKPDFLFSGINHGINTSIAVIYSGTLGAAAEGVLYHIPSAGFSINSYLSSPDFSACIRYGRQIIDTMTAHPFDNHTFLNINFPALPYEQIKGVRLCRQLRGVWAEEFEKRIDPHGEDYYWMSGQFVNQEKEAADADENAVLAGYVAVVPHHLDMTDYRELERLQSVWKF